MTRTRRDGGAVRRRRAAVQRSRGCGGPGLCRTHVDVRRAGGALPGRTDRRRLRRAVADGRHPLRQQAPRRRAGVEVPRQQPAGHPPGPRRRRAPEVPAAARPGVHGQARRPARRQRARARRRDDRHVRRRRRGAMPTRWCEPLPSTIFLSILGLPLADLDDFLHFKSLTLGNEFATLPFDEAMARREEAVVWIHDYFNRLLDDRLGAADPGDDLLGWLLTTEVEGERLPREDLLDILGLLMIAGLDTVAASLALLPQLPRAPSRRAAAAGRRPVVVAVGDRGAHAVRVAGDRRRPHRPRRPRPAERRAHRRRHQHGHLVARRQPRSRLLRRSAHRRLRPRTEPPHRRSPAGSTAASVRTWRGWRCTSRWRRGTGASPTTRSRRAPTSRYSGNPRAPHHLTLTW